MICRSVPSVVHLLYFSLNLFFFNGQECGNCVHITDFCPDCWAYHSSTSALKKQVLFVVVGVKGCACRPAGMCTYAGVDMHVCAVV